MNKDRPTPAPANTTSTPSPFMVASPASAGSSNTPASTPAPASASPQTPASFAFESPNSDSTSFILDEIVSSPTQAALRAIFGVDHEMNIDEILQRLRSLSGIRHLALVTGNDVSVIDGLKKSLGALGFGAANIRIFGGNTPMEFVRHENILLAVQTVNGFNPGVKDAITIATQEIHRLS